MFKAPKYDKEVWTKPLSDADASLLVGSVGENGRMLTKEEIKKCGIEKVYMARDIDTGEMKKADEKHNQTGIPFFVTRVSR